MNTYNLFEALFLETLKSLIFQLHCMQIIKDMFKKMGV